MHLANINSLYGVIYLFTTCAGDLDKT